MFSKRFVLILSYCWVYSLNASFLDTFKGIGSSIENFPLFHGSFYTGMARSFGAPPAGYVYSFSLYNDASVPVYIGIQEIVSIMGGSFPKAGGWSVVTVAPFEHHTILNKEYYFELMIKSTSHSPSNHMPYLHHDDVLYQKEVIQLQEPHSTKHNYFRSYIGKSLQNGVWAYMLKAEYLGFADPSAHGPHADKGLSLSSNLSSLTIKNSTSTDYYVGYTNQKNATTMTARSCLIFAKVQADSFALYNAPENTSLRPGTIGIFDAVTEQLLTTYDVRSQGFDGKGYTLEIAYCDILSRSYKSIIPDLYASSALKGSAQGAKLQLFMQGLMPGNYDVPVGRIRDITPVTCVFWYQSAASQKGLIDLPGKMWVVSQGADRQIMVSCTPGSAIQFDITRPEIDKKLRLYFLYVDSVDDVQSQHFLNSFIAGTIGSDTVEQYRTQSEQQWKRAEKNITDVQAIKKGAVAHPEASQALLVQAIDGALKMHQGRIQDPVSGITGYLLGGDVFLPQGVGSGTMYYQLAPSWKTPDNLPTMAVHNVYASTLGFSAPTGMPVPKVVSESLKASNKVKSAASAPVVAPASSILKKASAWVKSKVTKTVAPGLPVVSAAVPTAVPATVTT